MLFFMHVKYAHEKMTKLVIISAIFFCHPARLKHGRLRDPAVDVTPGRFSPQMLFSATSADFLSVLCG